MRKLTFLFRPLPVLPLATAGSLAARAQGATLLNSRVTLELKSTDKGLRIPYRTESLGMGLTAGGLGVGGQSSGAYGAAAGNVGGVARVFGVSSGNRGVGVVGQAGGACGTGALGTTGSGYGVRPRAIMILPCIGRLITRLLPC